MLNWGVGAMARLSAAFLCGVLLCLALLLFRDAFTVAVCAAVAAALWIATLGATRHLRIAGAVQAVAGAAGAATAWLVLLALAASNMD
jgi:hypothetical protein